MQESNTRILRKRTLPKVDRKPINILGKTREKNAPFSTNFYPPKQPNMVSFSLKFAKTIVSTKHHTHNSPLYAP